MRSYYLNKKQGLLNSLRIGIAGLMTIVLGGCGTAYDRNKEYIQDRQWKPYTVSQNCYHWDAYMGEDVPHNGDLYARWLHEFKKRNDFKEIHFAIGDTFLVPDMDGDGIVGEAELNDN